MLQEYVLEHNKDKIAVIVRRSARKSIGIEINTALKVTVRVPNRLSDKEIIKAVEEKKDWIVDKYELLASRQSNLVRMEQLYYEGAQLPFGETFLTLHLENVMNGQELRNAVINMYKQHGRELIHLRTKSYAQLMHLSVKNITIRDQKTRWGSCSSKGNLNFNWKLLMMPECILDYVIVHELCHLKQMNHSRLFWREVEKVLPDYKQRREWLTRHGKEYHTY